MSETACRLIVTCCGRKPDGHVYRLRRAARSCPHPQGNRFAGLESNEACAAACAGCEHAVEIAAARPSASSATVGAASIAELVLANMATCRRCVDFAGAGERAPCRAIATRRDWLLALAARGDCPRGLLKDEAVGDGA